MTLETAPLPRLSAPEALATKVFSFDPGDALLRVREKHVENGIVPVVLFVVAIIVLLALAAAVSIAVLIFCSQKGMNFSWYAKTSLFEIKVACKR